MSKEVDPGRSSLAQIIKDATTRSEPVRRNAGVHPGTRDALATAPGPVHQEREKTPSRPYGMVSQDTITASTGSALCVSDALRFIKTELQVPLPPSMRTEKTSLPTESGESKAETVVPQEALPPMKLNLAFVLRTAAKVTAVKVRELRGPSRKRRIARPRQVLCWFLKKRTMLSTPQIGRFVGNRDHSTVIHAVRKVDQLLGEEDAQVRIWLEELARRCDVELPEIERQKGV
jgi:hypothetical protein